MLTVLLLAVLAFAALLLVLFGALCLAIRKEDHGLSLGSQPPTHGTALTRRITGLTVRYDLHEPPARPSTVLHGPLPPAGEQERR
jgi:hypothetical protein